MAAPVAVDLTLKEAWPAFVLSGLTSSDAALNGTYAYAGGGTGTASVYRRAGTACYAYREFPGIWHITNDAGQDIFQTDGNVYAYPWDVPAWTTVSGTPAFARAAAPPFQSIVSTEVTVQASLTTALTGANNDLVFSSKASGPSGRLGNLVTVRYVSPGTNNATLSVSVSGLAITVNLATNGSAAITSTAALIKSAIEASAAARELVSVANAAANDGTGVVTALAATALTGGTGGRPLPPASVSL